MPRSICIANQKGGVGKTTTAINLSAAIARSGNRTLLVDLDPQCNATTGLGQAPVDEHGLVGERPLADSIVSSGIEHLCLLPGSRRFRDVDLLAQSGGEESQRVAERLIGGTHAYDYVVVDCPPSLGQLTRTALSASNEVLMPIQCEYFAMEGLTQMIEVIRDCIHTHRGQLEFGGILLTMYEPGLELTGEVDREVRDFFGDIVFETVVPRDVSVTEAPSHGLPVIDYAPRSRGTRAYIELCLEVIDRD